MTYIKSNFAAGEKGNFVHDNRWYLVVLPSVNVCNFQENLGLPNQMVLSPPNTNIIKKMIIIVNRSPLRRIYKTIRVVYTFDCYIECCKNFRKGLVWFY